MSTATAPSAEIDPSPVEFVKKLIISHPGIPSDIRLNQATFHGEIFSVANDILASNVDIEAIGSVINDLSNVDIAVKDKKRLLPLKTVKEEEFQSKYNGTLLSAFKIARSKALFNKARDNNPNGFHLTLVVPMYGEQDRMSPFPKGQDFVREKYKQLQWLFGDEEDEKVDRDECAFTWNILFVDDGCYENPKRFDADNNYAPKYPSSFESADRIIRESNLKRARALKLGDVCARVNVVKQAGAEQKDNTILYFDDVINPSKGSRRGGAVAYGMYVAYTECKPKEKERKHYIAASDADLSLHLAQFGGALFELQSNEKARMCVGARYGTAGSYLGYPDGIVIDHTQHLGPNRVRIVLRHLIRGLLIPGLKHIYDTQVGLKLFESEIIDTILSSAKDRDSSFEIETLLIIITKFGDKAIVTYPTYFTEDFESSKFTSGDNPGAYYFGQCKNILAMYEMFIAPTNPIKEDGSEPDRLKALEYCRNVDNKTFEEQWTAVEKNIPKDAFFDFAMTIDNIIDPATTKKI